MFLQNAEVFEQDLRAEQDEDPAAGKLCLALEAQADHAAEPDTGCGVQPDGAEYRSGHYRAEAGPRALMWSLAPLPGSGKSRSPRLSG